MSPEMPPASVALGAATLRAWSVADAPLMRAALEASESHLRAWTPWVVDGRVPGLSLEERLARHAAAFASGEEWVYGLFDPDEAEVLGGCGLYPRVGPGAVEIGYWLAAAHTGRGLATIAADALTRIAFDRLGVDRVEIRCDPRNVASARVPRRLGYTTDESALSPEGLMVWRVTREEYVRATPPARGASRS
jgi:RimJ/RimL family protein N-acetyltransferase